MLGKMIGKYSTVLTSNKSRVNIVNGILWYRAGCMAWNVGFQREREKTNTRSELISEKNPVIMAGKPQ